MSYCSGAFYPPIKYKTMNMCACSTPTPTKGDLKYVRSRPCACDICYGDLSCQYASRQLPRWGLPAMLPTWVPEKNEGMPLDMTYATKKTFNRNSRTFEQVKNGEFVEKIKPLPTTTVPRTSPAGIHNSVLPMTNLNGTYSLGQVEDVVVVDGPVSGSCAQPGILGKILGTGTRRVSNQVVTAMILGLVGGYYLGTR